MPFNAEGQDEDHGRKRSELGKKMKAKKEEHIKREKKTRENWSENELKKKKQSC